MSNKPSNTANIMILAFMPSHCPNCGDKWEGVNKYPADFWAGASHFCGGCGLRYQYVERDTILRAAEDLRYYWEQVNGKLQEDLTS